MTLTADYCLLRARGGGILMNEDWDKGRWFALYLAAVTGDDLGSTVRAIVEDALFEDQRFCRCFSWARHWPVEVMPLAFLWFWLKSGPQACVAVDLLWDGKVLMGPLEKPPGGGPVYETWEAHSLVTDCLVVHQRDRFALVEVEDLETVIDLVPSHLRRVK